MIIGHRGHAPTLFPEVYPDGRRDLRLAMQLYGSWQQVDDMEAVRQDMEKRGLLPPDGKVQLFGASGAGILVQQYLHRHPQNVSRVLLVSTGAPDAWRFGSWEHGPPVRSEAPGGEQPRPRGLDAEWALLGRGQGAHVRVPGQGALREFLNSDIEPPTLKVERHRFQGEVLVIAGLEDVVFSPVVAEAFAREYPNSRFIAVHGGAPA